MLDSAPEIDDTWHLIDPRQILVDLINHLDVCLTRLVRH